MKLVLPRLSPLQSLLLPVLCGMWISGAPVQAEADHPEPPPNGGMRGHKPPAAAYTACVDQSEDDLCSVTFGKRTVEGTCVKDPHADDAALFCRPDHPPGPPPEAAAACTDKAAGDSCSVTMPGSDTALTGSCVAGKDSTLSCRPARGQH